MTNRPSLKSLLTFGFLYVIGPFGIILLIAAALKWVIR